MWIAIPPQRAFSSVTHLCVKGLCVSYHSIQNQGITNLFVLTVLCVLKDLQM